MDKRSVSLRSERRGEDSSHLGAKLVDDVGLVVEGHDFGPGTAPVSDDGEYEYRYEIPNASFPELLRRLGAAEDADLIAVLHAWRGSRSYDFERLTRDLRVKFWCWP